MVKKTTKNKTKLAAVVDSYGITVTISPKHNDKNKDTKQSLILNIHRTNLDKSINTQFNEVNTPEQNNTIKSETMAMQRHADRKLTQRQKTKLNLI